MRLRPRRNSGGEAPSRRRVLRCLVAAVLVLAVLLALDHLAVPMLLQRGAAQVQEGAEPLELGPDNAPCAVLMIHGYLGGSNNFGRLPHQLAEQGWRVKVMRLPGHGTSPLELARTSAQDLRQAVRAEYDALAAKHPRVVLVGHSMGGALAALTAADVNPAGLVLLAPCFGIERKWYYLLPPETWARTLAPLVPWVYKPAALQRVNRPKVRSRIFTYHWVPTRSAIVLADLCQAAASPGTLERITCPVLWLHAINDFAAAYPDAERAFNAIPAPNKQHLRLERSDHILCWDHDRETVAALVIQFIAALSRPAL